MLLLFYFLAFWRRGMRTLSSLTKNWTHIPCIGSWSLNYWTAREIPRIKFLMMEFQTCNNRKGFPGGSVVKNYPANAGDTGSVSESERSPGEENGNPLQYSCLGNPMDRGAWQASVYGVTKSQTRLSNRTITANNWKQLWGKKYCSWAVNQATCVPWYRGHRDGHVGHTVWQCPQWLKSGPPRHSQDVLVTFSIRVATLFWLCKKHLASQTNPVCSWPIYFLAIRKQVVASASLAHLSCVSVSKQLVKTNLALSASPCCGGGRGWGLDTHMFTQALSDLANILWQVAHYSEQNHKALGFDYKKRLWFKKKKKRALSQPHVVPDSGFGVERTLPVECLFHSHRLWAEFCPELDQHSQQQGSPSRNLFPGKTQQG